MSKDNRYRNFMTELYPESASSDWLEKVKDLHVPGFISPLHDKDINDDGSLKKPHWHLMFMFDGKKSIEQVRDLFSTFGGVGCDKVNNVRSYARYLCHLDESDKVLYSIDDIISLCGADYYEIISLPSEKYAHIGEIMQFCIVNQIYSFSELSLYSMVHRKDWFRILCDKNTFFIREFLKSIQWENNTEGYIKRIDDFGNPLFDLVNPGTGEVINV